MFARTALYYVRVRSRSTMTEDVSIGADGQRKEMQACVNLTQMEAWD